MVKASWSSLPLELLEEVSKRLDSIDDFMSFGVVCRSWKSASVNKNFDSSKQSPWLMVCSSEDGKIHFFDPKTRMPYKVVLPIDIRNCGRGNIATSHGWIWVADPHKRFGSGRLMHPFSRREIELPQYITVGGDTVGDTVITTKLLYGLPIKIVLSCNPSGTSEFSVMMLDMCSRLAFYKQGDETLTRVLETEDSRGFMDVVFYKGQFYCVAAIFVDFSLFVYDATAKKTRFILKLPVTHTPNRLHLIELSGSLLVISRTRNQNPEVFQVDVERKECKVVTELNDKALFITDHISVVIHNTRGSNWKANCMYLTRCCRPRFISGRFYTFHGTWLCNGDYEDEDDVVVYDVQTRSFQTRSFQARFDSCYGIISPPGVWIQPSLD